MHIYHTKLYIWLYISYLYEFSKVRKHLFLCLNETTGVRFDTVKSELNFARKHSYIEIHFLYLDTGSSNETIMAVIGIDLGGTKLAGALFHPDGQYMNKVIMPLENRKGDEVGDLINSLIRTETDFAKKERVPIRAIGCCVPGIAYSATGRVWAPNIGNWEDYPLLEKMRMEVPDDSIRVLLDNDRACSLSGEVWKGAAQHCNHVVFLAVGTGIGAGIMTDGRILRGSADAAGAIGWLALNPAFREGYTHYGCFEYHASGDGLLRVTRDFLELDRQYSGMLRYSKPEALTTQSIFDAFRQKDPIALQVVNQAICYWGMTVANLISLFNPEKIIFGGGVFGPAAEFLEDILLEAKKWAQPVSINQVKIEASILGGDAGLFGAAWMALSH
jgi:glucokinase